MPRNYTRVTATNSWTESELSGALQAIRKGMSINKAAITYKIPRSTLRSRLKSGKTEKGSLGRNTVFTVEQEQELANDILQLSNTFFGVTPQDLRKAVYEYAERNHIAHNFNKEKREAGRDWYYAFLQRNPGISLRTSNPKLVRGETETKIPYDNLEVLIEEDSAFEDNFDEASQTSTVEKMKNS